MTKQELQTAISNLKETIVFELEQVDFEAVNQEGTTTGYSLYIWSTNSYEGVFYATSILPLFNNRNSYVEYNEKEKRVQLKIY